MKGDEAPARDRTDWWFRWFPCGVLTSVATVLWLVLPAAEEANAIYMPPWAEAVYLVAGREGLAGGFAMLAYFAFCAGLSELAPRAAVTLVLLGFAALCTAIVWFLWGHHFYNPLVLAGWVLLCAASLLWPSARGRALLLATSYFGGAAGMLLGGFYFRRWGLVAASVLALALAVAVLTARPQVHNKKTR